MIWCKYSIPEDHVLEPMKHYYLVKLKSGGIVKAERINRRWFGMWRWIRNEEVKEWKELH